MPNTLIETRAGWIKDAAEVINAVQSAMIAGFEIPERDRTVRLVEHAADHFAVPPEAGPRYTIVESKVVTGRSADAKRKLYQAIAANLEKIGVPPGDIKVALVEVPPENWGIRGGQMLADVLQIKKV